MSAKVNSNGAAANFSAYKPKSSCLEIGILKSKDEQSIDKFKAALREQEASQKQKQQKIEMEQKYQSELQQQMEAAAERDDDAVRSAAGEPAIHKAKT